MENCRIANLMSNVLQGLHIKLWWLKAPLGHTQMCEHLNPGMYILPLCKTHQEVSCPLQGRTPSSPWKDWRTPDDQPLREADKSGGLVAFAQKRHPLCCSIWGVPQPLCLTIYSLLYAVHFKSHSLFLLLWTILVSLPLAHTSQVSLPFIRSSTSSWIRMRFPFAQSHTILGQPLPFLSWPQLAKPYLLSLCPLPALSLPAKAIAIALHIMKMWSSMVCKKHHQYSIE